MKKAVWIVLIELLVMLDYPIKAYLEGIASRSYDMRAYMIYSIVAYVVFGMLAGGVKNVIDKSRKRVSVIFFILNIILTPVHYILFDSHFSALLIILLGFSLVSMIHRLGRNR